MAQFNFQKKNIITDQDLTINCNSCQDQNTCTQCGGSHYQLLNGICVDSCILNKQIYVSYYDQCQQVPTCSSNQFYNSTTNQCYNCPTGCTTCSSSTYCTQCNVPQYQINSNGICQDICAQNQTTWNPASSSCQTLCQSGQYFSQTSQNCQNCKQNCISCTNSSYCLTCDASTIMQSLQGNQNGNQCASKCTSSQFYNFATSSCQQCTSPCLTCSITSTNCSSCISSQFTVNNGTCIDVCIQNGQVWNSQTQSCQTNPDPPKFTINVQNPQIMRCRSSTVALSIISGFPMNLISSSQWSFSISNQAQVSNYQQIQQALNTLAQNSQNLLQLTIPASLTEMVISSQVSINLTVIVTNNQGISATNYTTRITFISSVITQITNNAINYLNTNIYSSYSGIQLQFLYPECPTLSLTPQSIPSGVDINCVLYDSNMKYILQLNYCIIPAKALNFSSLYIVKYNYLPNNVQTSLSDIMFVETSGSNSLSLSLIDDQATLGYFAPTVNHTITCSVPTTGNNIYYWIVVNQTDLKTPLKTDGSGALYVNPAYSSNLIVLQNQFLYGQISVSCYAFNTQQVGNITKIYKSKQSGSLSLLSDDEIINLSSGNTISQISGNKIKYILIGVFTLFILLLAVISLFCVLKLRKSKQSNRNEIQQAENNQIKDNEKNTQPNKHLNISSIDISLSNLNITSSNDQIDN